MYEGDYLRVLSPRTDNGINPILDEDGKVIYKEVHLPISAKAELEKANDKLPAHLRKKIEVVSFKKKVEEKKNGVDQAKTIEPTKAAASTEQTSAASKAVPAAQTTSAK